MSASPTFSASRAPRLAAGSLILHPLTLLAGAALVLNDHLFKRCFPGTLSGKLSDFSGMVFGPIVIAAVLELVLTRATGNGPSPRLRARLLLGAALATAAVFTLMKTTAFGSQAYGLTFGLLQWPFRALAAVSSGGALPPVAPVAVARDPSDLIALPLGAVPWLLATGTPPPKYSPATPRTPPDYESSADSSRRR